MSKWTKIKDRFKERFNGNDEDITPNGSETTEVIEVDEDNAIPTPIGDTSDAKVYEDAKDGKASYRNWEWVEIDDELSKMFENARLGVTMASTIFSYVIPHVTYRFSRDIETACAIVDGDVNLIVFNPDVFKDLINDKVRAFILMHELSHIYLFHASRCIQMGYHPLLWNYATDFFINNVSRGMYRDSQGKIAYNSRYEQYMGFDITKPITKNPIPTPFVEEKDWAPLRTLFNPEFLDMTPDEIYEVLLDSLPEDLKNKIMLSTARVGNKSGNTTRKITVSNPAGGSGSKPKDANSESSKENQQGQSESQDQSQGGGNPQEGNPQEQPERQSQGGGGGEKDSQGNASDNGQGDEGQEERDQGSSNGQDQGTGGGQEGDDQGAGGQDDSQSDDQGEGVDEDTLEREIAEGLEDFFGGERPHDDIQGDGGTQTQRQKNRQTITGAVSYAQSVSQQGGDGVGDAEGAIIRMVLEMNTPQTKWQDIIHEIVVSKGDHYNTYSRFNPRSTGDIIFPSTYSHSIDVIVQADTSGSMGEEDYRDVVGELYGLVEQFDSWKLTLGTCDVKHYIIGEYSSEDGDDFESIDLSLPGGGGTILTPMVAYAEDQMMLESRELAANIIITDGGFNPEELLEGNNSGMWMANHIIIITGDGNKGFKLDHPNFTVIHLESKNKRDKVA